MIISLFLFLFLQFVNITVFQTFFWPVNTTVFKLFWPVNITVFTLILTCKYHSFYTYFDL